MLVQMTWYRDDRVTIFCDDVMSLSVLYISGVMKNVYCPMGTIQMVIIPLHVPLLTPDGAATVAVAFPWVRWVYSIVLNWVW